VPYNNKLQSPMIEKRRDFFKAVIDSVQTNVDGRSFGDTEGAITDDN